MPIKKPFQFLRPSQPGLRPSQPPMKTKEKVEQGKGTADHLMPLGDWSSMS